MTGGRRVNGGRKPKPPGTRLGHRPDPRPISMGGKAVPEELQDPPDTLPPDGVELWNTHIIWLVETGLVDRVDVGALEALCMTYARAKQADRVVNVDGLFVEGARGQPAIHPAYRIARESWDSYYRMIDQFGMTPLARIRLGIAELGRKSLAAELQEKLGPVHLEVVEGTASE